MSRVHRAGVNREASAVEAVAAVREIVDWVFLEAGLVVIGKLWAVDIADHALLSSTLVRLAQRIGINRAAKDLTPSLDDYLRSPSLPDGEGAE